MFKELIEKIEAKYPLIGAGIALAVSLVFNDSDVKTVSKDNKNVAKTERVEETNYFFLHFNEMTEEFQPVLSYNGIEQKNNFTFYGNNLTFVIMYDEPMTLTMDIDKSDNIIYEKIYPDKRIYKKYKREVTLDSSLTLIPNKKINSLYFAYDIPHLSPSDKYRLTIVYNDYKKRKKFYKTSLTQKKFFPKD
jgi:hypothetical protein